MWYNFVILKNMKNFNIWNKVKKETDEKISRPKIKTGDVFWCRYGINIGFEQNGKNENSIRPVIVIKKYTSNVVFAIPLTTKIHDGDWYFNLEIDGEKVQAILNQGRTLDTKRFENFIVNMPENKIKELIDAFIKLFYK